MYRLTHPNLRKTHVVFHQNLVHPAGEGVRLAFPEYVAYS